MRKTRRRPARWCSDTYHCWQNAEGKHEIKQDGCVVVRVPSVDWERNGCAFPGRLPVLPIASSRSRGSTAGTGT
jgi:hypothetical protein